MFSRKSLRVGVFIREKRDMQMYRLCVECMESEHEREGGGGGKSRAWGEVGAREERGEKGGVRGRGEGVKTSPHLQTEKPLHKPIEEGGREEKGQKGCFFLCRRQERTLCLLVFFCFCASPTPCILHHGRLKLPWSCMSLLLRTE